MPPAVQLTAVRKTYGGAVVVDDLTLSVAEGEFFSLLGSSGCGKSTTLRLIAGFETADAGVVVVGGVAAGGREPAYAKRVNMVFQNYALFPHMTVAENVAFGLKMSGMARAARDARTREMLTLVQMEGFADRMPAMLSGGQQQRVALARAMATNPQVVLLDEPLGALDLKLRREMQQELKRIQQDRGLTFVYVTHDQEEALSMSDRLCVMHAGRAMQTGTPQEIYSRPASRFVAGFIGENNVLPWRHPEGGREVFLAVRPEDIRCSPGAGDGGLYGTVTESVYQGADCLVHVSLAGGQVVKIRRSGRGGALPPGTGVHLTWPEEAAWLLEP